MAMIDLILETARRLGLERSPLSLGDLHRAYLRDHPEATVGRSKDSFDATLNFHCINMRSRFPKPREPRASAAWSRRPLFKRVAPGQYMLLSPAELAWIHDAIKCNDQVYLDEYEVPIQLAPPDVTPVMAEPAPSPRFPEFRAKRSPSSGAEAPALPPPIMLRATRPAGGRTASAAEILDARLKAWLAAHDQHLNRFATPLPLSELGGEIQVAEVALRARLTDGHTPPYHLWPHTHAGVMRRTKPYALRLGGPNGVALDWEESVIGAAEAEFARRGFETQRQLGSDLHLQALLRTPCLATIDTGLNLRDLWALRANARHLDLWIVEAKGKEAGGFEHYCVAEALGQLFPVPAAPLSELLGSARGPGHGRCWLLAQQLIDGWRAQGLEVNVTLGVLLPFWEPDVVWGADNRERVIDEPYFHRPLRALNEFIETGHSAARSGRFKYERAFGATLEAIESACALRALARSDGGLRFRVLLASSDQAGNFQLLGLG